MKSTHPLYNEVRQQFEQLWKDKKGNVDLKMVEFCVKDAHDAVKLTDGSIVILKKPSIQKDFCFGWYTFDEDSYDEATHNARELGRDKEYFMNNNLSGLEENIDRVKNSTDDMYLCDSYRPWMTLKHYVFLRFEEDLWMYHNPRKSANETEDRKLILAALEKIKVDFTKRLETWWKKYGADYIHTWTYCHDD